MTMSSQKDEEDFQSRFPFRLHKLLSHIEEQGFTHTMSWLPCGTRFKIHDTERFTSEIMPSIGRCTQYKSFLRQLSMYKFHRTMSGPLKGTYYHPYFRRGDIEACRGVLRGRAPMAIANYQKQFDGKILTMPNTVTGNEVRTQTAGIRETSVHGGFHHNTICYGALVPPVLSDTDSETKWGDCFSSLKNAENRSTIDEFLEPAEEYSQSHLVEALVKPDEHANVSKSSWIRQGTVLEELETFSSALASFSSNPRNTPADVLTHLPSPSSFPDDGCWMRTIITPSSPNKAPEEAKESWRLGWREGYATADIVDEIISTFSTPSY